MARPGPESWQRNVWALALIVFTAFVGFQFFSPFLPLFVQELGVSDSSEVAVWSGLLMAVTPGLAGLLGPLWGRLADRVGRKFMMVRSLAGFIVTRSEERRVGKEGRHGMKRVQKREEIDATRRSENAGPQ